ncbi:MAG: hypothetical protein ACPGF8_07135, partial [Opitutales bacterium]
APEKGDSTAESEVKPALTEAQESELKQLKMDLRWLVTEGYVTEYGDGRLFAPLPMAPASPKSKNAKPDEGRAANATEASVPVAEEAPATEGASTDVVESETTEPVSQQATSEADVPAEESTLAESAPEVHEPQQSEEEPVQSEEGDADSATNPKD